MTEAMIYRLLPSAYKILPGEMYDLKATTMLIAIGLQESRFEHRRQVKGSARGFWQFEPAGAVGVQKHKKTAKAIAAAGAAFCYPKIKTMTGAELVAVLEHNDVLAAVFARCLLWTLPAPLPQTRDDEEAGWEQYVAAWQPGKPHRATWTANYTAAWQLIDPAV